MAGCEREKSARGRAQKFDTLTRDFQRHATRKLVREEVKWFARCVRSDETSVKEHYKIMNKIFLVLATALLIFSTATGAQQQNAPAQQPDQSIYHVTMVGKTVTAVNYQHRSGSTMIDFAGTPLMPLAKGDAKVDSKQGSIQITANFKGLQSAQMFGKEYLTFVLWAITPEGKPSNLGEVLLNGSNSKLTVTTPLQSFGMIVTAEPYFAVSMPSDVVVLENILRADTRGTSQQVTANYELLHRGQYTYDMSKARESITDFSPKVPLEVYEARNAVAIAQSSGAENYAPEAYQKAVSSLNQAESLLKRKANRKEVIAAARDAVQTAADARQISLKRADDQRQAAEQAAAQAAVNSADAKRKQEEEARHQAELQKLQAERDAAREAAARAEADAARNQAEAARTQADAARSQADAERAAALQKEKEAQDAAAQSEAEKQQLRAALLDQFNRILPTTDTPRGLQVNMADVLFAFGKYDLKPTTRESLAKFTGIVLAHPGLHLSVEGYTDSVGSDAFNQTLSEQRAGAVRDYLVQQGLDAASITATGFGKTNPVASNDTPAGRQQNRRVEIIISGEVIGTKIGGASSPQ
jgi:outer membrane protein OmpA-like peptidoglycan-associated protein